MGLMVRLIDEVHRHDEMDDDDAEGDEEDNDTHGN